MAVVFPEAPEAALSTLGWQVVYRLLAEDDLFCVEPVFADPASPRPRSLHTGTDLGRFALVLASLNFEGDYPALVRLFMDAGIPVLAQDRADWPLIMAGGPVAFLNPFPVLPALDALWCGEAEAGFLRVAQSIAHTWVHKGSKGEALEAIAAIPGCLVPGQSPLPVERQVAADLRTPAHSVFVSPEAQFAGMFLLEVNRGCPYGCRFCAAGSIYRPARQAPMEVLQRIVEDASPHKVGLVGTALTDWPDLMPFLSWLRDRRAHFSLSSVRADGLNEDLLAFLRHAGVRTVTLALEGASSRLRAAMNKGLDEDAVLRVVATMSRLRFETLKLYLIVGWPGEEEADFKELEGFLERIQQARRAGQAGRAAGLKLIQLSASALIPKPWTAMQWAPMASIEAIEAAMGRVRAMVARHRGMRFSAENARQACIQGYLARADEGAWPVIVEAAQHGWAAVWRRHGAHLEAEACRPRSVADPLPWERLRVGVRRAYVRGQWEAFGRSRPTPACPPGSCSACRRCGMERVMGTMFEEEVPQP
ncbi:MAG: radical SAM protein [Desulfomicrobiaceae bacterium]